MEQSRGGWFLSRTVRELTGGRINSDVPLPVSYSQATVEALIARIRSTVDRPARDARVTVDGRARLVTVVSKDGVVVDVAALRRELTRALGAPTVRHRLSVPVSATRPAV